MSVYISALAAPRWAVTGGLALHVYLGHATAFRGPGEERHFLSRQTSVENRAAVKEKKKLAAGKKKKKKAAAAATTVKTTVHRQF